MANDDHPGPESRRVLRAIVAGRVQGVGYRDWALAEAEALRLEGFVRNRASGEVEAVVAGPAAAVALMCEKFWRGPPAARVSAVELFEAGENELALRGEGAGFVRLPTV
ncbi:acylphosphatase [Methylocella sp.]|uniref:acylphosphatase n=1 Tax=Methylocella sp. TaxID=1978226 RepID=UPI003783AA1B